MYFTYNSSHTSIPFFSSWKREKIWLIILPYYLINFMVWLTRYYGIKLIHLVDNKFQEVLAISIWWRVLNTDRVIKSVRQELLLDWFIDTWPLTQEWLRENRKETMQSHTVKWAWNTWQAMFHWAGFLHIPEDGKVDLFKASEDHQDDEK